MTAPITYRELELEVIRWAEARKIIPNSTPKAQAQKTLEECGELVEAATALQLLREFGVSSEHPTYQHWLGKYRDAVGDIVVTLINGAALADVDVVQCLATAYDEIKDRTGTLMPNGIFVKDVVALKVVGEVS